MNTVTSKVCVVGDFAVGKTSTVERFVNNHFSEKYLTTVGVKIDTKEVALPEHGVTQKMVLWDVAGKEIFGDIEMAYLRGASGYIFVADGTRSATIYVAKNLRKEIEARYGPRPFVLLLNKSDLKSAWEVSDALLEELRSENDHVFVTSAKTGDDVEEALTTLATLITDSDTA